MPPNINTLSRSSTIDDLEHNEFDLIVIGGGITGAGSGSGRGLARAVRRPARGGRLCVGDLEPQLEADPRRPALPRAGRGQPRPQDRAGAQGDLPGPRHTCPSRAGWSCRFAGRTMLYSLRLAVTTYERLGAVEREDIHRAWAGSTLAEQEPALDRVAFPHALAYREYLTDDARLVIANLRSRGPGSARRCSTTPRCRAVLRSGDRATGVEARLRDQRRGFAVHGRVIVNAAGPWVEADPAAREPERPPVLAPEQGHPHLDPRHQAAGPQPVGAQHPRQAADLRDSSWRRGLYRDHRYDLRARRRGLARASTRMTSTTCSSPSIATSPRPAIRSEDVVGAWAGLRPLIADPTKKNPSELSRRDELLFGPLGVRRSPEASSRAIAAWRGGCSRPRRPAGSAVSQAATTSRRCPAATSTVTGGADQRLSAAQRLDEPTAARLARLFGDRGRPVLALGRRRSSRLSLPDRRGSLGGRARGRGHPRRLVLPAHPAALVLGGRDPSRGAVRKPAGRAPGLEPAHARSGDSSESVGSCARTWASTRPNPAWRWPRTANRLASRLAATLWREQGRLGAPTDDRARTRSAAVEADWSAALESGRAAPCGAQAEA